MRRLPVRILHVRPDHVGGGVAQGTLRPRRRGGEGTDERQHLPLRSLCQYRRGNPKSSQKHLVLDYSWPVTEKQISPVAEQRVPGSKFKLKFTGEGKTL